MYDIIIELLFFIRIQGYIATLFNEILSQNTKEREREKREEKRREERKTI